MIYEPAEDSHLLAELIPRYARGKSVLDLGTGSGIQARTAKEAGARSVEATDINPEAVRQVRAQGIKAYRSDLFKAVKKKFDLIVCNPPYLPYDAREDTESQRATTGGKKGDEYICRFLAQLTAHLAPGGVCLLLLSSLTPRTRIKALLAKKKLTARTIGRKALFMESLEVWEIKRKEQ